MSQEKRAQRVDGLCWHNENSLYRSVALSSSGWMALAVGWLIGRFEEEAGWPRGSGMLQVDRFWGEIWGGSASTMLILKATLDKGLGGWMDE